MNNIDSDITKALLKSERHAKMKERPPWSPELKMASLHVKLLKLYLQQIQTKQNLSNAIKHTISCMGGNL